LNFVSGECRKTHDAAAQGHVLDLDAVFVEQPVEQRAVQVNKTPGNRTVPTRAEIRASLDCGKYGLA
jgi:hypothetical protein